MSVEYRRVFCFTLYLILISGCNRSTAPEPLYLGHLAPAPSGEGSAGEQARHGILLAIEEENKDPARLPGRPYAVLHPTLPDNDPEKLQPVAVRLIQVDRVLGLLGGTDSAQVDRLSRATQPYELPVLTTAELPPDSLADNVYSLAPSLVVRGQVLATFAAKELKLESVAILVDSTKPANSALATAFAKEYSKLTGTSGQDFSYKTEAELYELSDRIRKSPPKSLFFAGSLTDLVKFKSKLKAAGIDIPILLGGETPSTGLLVSAKEGLANVYLTTPFAGDNGSPQSQGFAKAYRDRFHTEPDAHAALSYEGIRIIVEAIRRAQALRPTSAFRIQLTKSQENPFDSLEGKLTFKKDQTAHRPLFVARVEQGKLTNHKKYEPTEK